MTRYFKTTMDQSTKSMTILVSVIILVVSFSSFYFTGGRNNWQTGVALTLVFAVLYVTCYYLAPALYQITESKLLIKGGWILKKIELNDISQATLVQSNEAPIFRLMGMGGLFGYIGWFYNRQWGRFLLFGRRRTGTFVALKLKSGQVIMLTPDDPDGLLTALSN